MKLSDLNGLFSLTSCQCGEEHYLNEPCPRCTAGEATALEARLSASMAREKYLMAMLGIEQDGEIPDASQA
jgi:hypothetical protein